MEIDEALYYRFRRRYGTLAANLIIFYTKCKSHDDRHLREHYSERSYYRYRHKLLGDGYLTVADFQAKAKAQ